MTLAARDLAFRWPGGEDVLRGVDLEVRSGALCCVLGPNGSGKTTLLRCLLGHLAPSGGEVLLDGRSVMAWRPADRARRVAYVPQFPTSAFGFTVEELVLAGRYARLGPLGLAGPPDREKVEQALDRTGTLHLRHRGLDEISGGEAQRVMVARALAQEPEVLLLDEPTSHLDLHHQLAVYGLLAEVAAEGMAVLAVSHDLNVAARFAGRLVLLREGRVVADGPPAAVLAPGVLEATFGVRVELVPVPGGGVPMVRGHLTPR